MKLAQQPPQTRVRVHFPGRVGLCLLVAMSLLVAACGGSSSNTSAQTAATPAATRATAPAKQQPATSSPSMLSLSPKGDMLMFDSDHLTAKAGKVTVKFTNRSAISHDVVLIDSANKVLGRTPTFDGGTKSFSVTLKPGTYTYYCAVPGHRQAGMQGTLTVK